MRKIIFMALAGLCGAQASAQTNLLLNRGLETPFLSAPNGQIATGWTNNFSFGANLSLAKETSNIHGGTNCQKVVVTGITATNSALFFQPFSFSAGSVYNGSVWLRAASNSLVQFCLRDADNHFQAGASAIATVGTNWQQLLITGGFQNGTNAQFAVSFLSNGTIWIDDASLTDVTSNYLQAPPLNTNSSVPATLFGMHINQLTAKTNWPPLQQGLVRFWDVGLNWASVETNQGTYTWIRFDAGTNVVHTNNPNCKVLYTFGHTPQWAALNPNATNAKGVPDGSSSEPRDMNDWSNYVHAVATRYKGSIQYYEIWNETDYKGFYSGALSNMVTMAQIARNVITNVDPGAKILGPNITLAGLSWLEQFIQAGGPPPDIVTFHNYPTSRPEDSLGEVVGLRDLLSRYPAWSSLPIWCTEGAPNIGASTEENRGIVARCYLFWWWQNIPNWSWYAWDLTNVNNTFQVPLSVSTPGQTPTAAGIAYSNTVNWLVGAQMTGMTTSTNGTRVATLQRLGSINAHVLWNPDVTTNYAIPEEWKAYQKRDLSNTVTSLVGAANVSVGVAPVILDSIPSLAISNVSDTTVSLLWPAPATGFNLYSTTNLASANWLQITNQFVNSNGNVQVPVARTNANSFFRLGTP